MKTTKRPRILFMTVIHSNFSVSLFQNPSWKIAWSALGGEIMLASYPAYSFQFPCMVSEITRSYCQPDMTSSSVLRQGALHALFHDGFWKSDHVFLILIHCTFICDAWFPRYWGSMISLPKALHAIFHDGFWKSDHDFPIVIHVTFYHRCMVFEITRFYCKPDMTPSSVLRRGAQHTLFHDGFWKSGLDFLIVIHSNFLSAVHGSRDNEVLLQAGYDIIVSPSPGGAARTFSWRILKGAALTFR